MSRSTTTVAPSDGINPVEEQRVAEAIESVRSIRLDGAPIPTNINTRLGTARAIIAYLDTTGFMTWRDRFDDQIFVISELQNLAYHETDNGGVQDIAQWCIRQYLFLLNNSQEERIETLTGMKSVSWSQAFY